MTISTNRKVQRTRTISFDGEGPLDWGNDVIKVPTYDSNDQIFFKVFDEADPNTVLSEAKLSPQMILVSTPAFARTPAQLKFKSKLEGTMQVDLMYRCSEFTASPQGKLHLTLDQGIAMKNKKDEYQPRMEFILNNQRIWVDEELVTKKKLFKDEGEFKRWNLERSLTLESNSVSDCLIIKFYDLREDDLVLLGCEYVELSALLLVKVDKAGQQLHAAGHKLQQESTKSEQTKNMVDDCRYENVITVNLKRVNSSMSGEIIIKCDYRKRIYSESSGAKGRQDITLKLREQMIQDAGLTKKIRPEGQGQEEAAQKR
jgi:hypothetical protein